MKREPWESPDFTQSGDICQKVMADYSRVPIALHGNMMEKEAYLDLLFPSSTDTKVLHKKKRLGSASRR